MQEALLDAGHHEADLVHVRRDHDPARRAFRPGGCVAGDTGDQVPKRVGAQFCDRAAGQGLFAQKRANEFFGPPLGAGRRVDRGELLEDLANPGFVHAPFPAEG